MTEIKLSKASGLAESRFRLPEVGLLRWWLDGLGYGMPQRFRRGATRQHVLELAGSHALLVFEHHGRRDEFGMLASQDAEAAGSLKRISASKGKRVILRLKKEDVLTHRITLPAAVKSNLRQVLGFEMDRITPFSVDQVYYDHRVVEQSPDQNQLVVEIALVQKKRLDSWLKLLSDQKIQVASVECGGLWKGINLLPPELRFKGEGDGGIRLTWMLALIVLLLAAASLIGPLWQNHEEVLELEERLSTARKQSDIVVEIRNRLEQREVLSRFVMEKREAVSPTVDLLREVTLLLPDDTWLQQLDIDDDQVEIRGESTQATKLIAILESSPMFSAVAFKSPVVAIPAKEVEKFHIGMAVSRENVQ